MNRLITLVFASFVSSISFAGLFEFTPKTGSAHVAIGDNGVGCLKSAMTIESMTNLANGSNPSPLPVNATDCYAVSAPDNDFASNYSSNTGVLNEGMLNGESFKDYHVDPNLFLDNTNDQWVDDNTPGWISLASVNGAEKDDQEGLDPFEVTYSEIGGINLDELLDITFGINNDDGMGFWSLGFGVDAGDIIDDVEALLGRPTGFDHLSFILKGANKEDWYMYDFSFWDLIDNDLDIDINTPHNISGTWDPSLFFGGKDVSHIEIVAHDPPPNSIKVPEPKSLVIFTFGLALLVFRHKMKV
jgi:hypothetical protein